MKRKLCGYEIDLNIKENSLLIETSVGNSLIDENPHCRSFYVNLDLKFL